MNILLLQKVIICVIKVLVCFRINAVGGGIQSFAKGFSLL